MVGGHHIPKRGRIRYRNRPNININVGDNRVDGGLPHIGYTRKIGTDLASLGQTGLTVGDYLSNGLGGTPHDGFLLQRSPASFQLGGFTWDRFANFA